MFFKNYTLFRFPNSLDFDGLADALAELPKKPVGPMELSSRGFVPPHGADSEDYAPRIGSAVWVTVAGEDKILPASTVNDLLQKKIDEFEKQNGRRPGGRMRKQMKDDLIAELLPRLLTKPSRTDAMLDLERGYIAVNTSSRKAGEEVVSLIRTALGSFPALPINAEVAPRSVMTGWIAGDALPEGLSLGDECELRDPADYGAVVKVQRMELAGEEITSHLEAGKQVTRLALTFDDRIGFVLGEDLVLRKFKLLDGAIEGLESQERDDLRAELDARFALQSGEFGRLFDVLQIALSLSTAQ